MTELIEFLLLELQNRLEGIVPVSGLLAIISVGIIINQKYDVLAKRLSVKYNKLWLGAEIFLFVLVGIAVDLKYALAAGVVVILLVILALVFRMMGVAISLVKTKLNKKAIIKIRVKSIIKLKRRQREKNLRAAVFFILRSKTAFLQGHIKDVCF